MFIIEEVENSKVYKMIEAIDEECLLRCRSVENLYIDRMQIINYIYDTIENDFTDEELNAYIGKNKLELESCIRDGWNQRYIDDCGGECRLMGREDEDGCEYLDNEGYVITYYCHEEKLNASLKAYYDTLISPHVSNVIREALGIKQGLDGFKDFFYVLSCFRDKWEYFYPTSSYSSWNIDFQEICWNDGDGPDSTDETFQRIYEEYMSSINKYIRDKNNDQLLSEWNSFLVDIRYDNWIE